MNTDPDCLFCKIAEGTIPSTKVYEDDETLAFMDINPASPGHVLVIPKHHVPDIYSAPDDALAAAIATSAKVARAVKQALSPYGLNIVQANGPGAAQGVFHIHFHVLPRGKDDDLKLNWGLNPGDEKEIAAVAEKIRSAME